jgi:hypothetical protein
MDPLQANMQAVLQLRQEAIKWLKAGNKSRAICMMKQADELMDLRRKQYPETGEYEIEPEGNLLEKLRQEEMQNG